MVKEFQCTWKQRMFFWENSNISFKVCLLYVKSLSLLHLRVWVACQHSSTAQGALYSSVPSTCKCFNKRLEVLSCEWNSLYYFPSTELKCIIYFHKRNFYSLIDTFHLGEYIKTYNLKQIIVNNSKFLLKLVHIGNKKNF